MLSPSIARRGPLTTTGRHYPLLVLLALLVVVPLLLLVLPAAEFGKITIYFALLAILAVVLYRVGIKPVDPAFPASLFVLALLAKLVGSLARYWTAVDLYGGASDAPLYHQHGQILAQYFRIFDFSIMESYVVRGEGTTQLAYVTGFLYSLLPATMAGAYFAFAIFAFTGSVLFYRSARVAWPDASTDIYRIFIFFLPSIVFWPSSLGKEAWLFGWAGLIMWGWVIFTRRGNLLGLLWIALGLLMINMIRAHFAAFLALGMGAAYLLYSTRGQRSLFGWLIGACVVGAFAVYLLQSGAEHLQLEELSLDSAQQRMEQVQGLTMQGGSRFATESIFTPWGLLWGLFTTIARPFPWEANNPQVLIASLETMSWLVVGLWRWRTLAKKLLQLRSDPVTGFAFFYTLLLLLAFTTFSNFGILARQRVMALPFLLMLLI